MSLRMHVYGWSFEVFQRTLASKDAALLQAASSRLTDVFDDAATRARSQAWLATLIDKGHPLARDRQRATQPADGGLLTMHMETEAHVFALHCLLRELAGERWLDFSEESQDWKQASVSALHNELANLGFSRPTNDDPKRWFMDYVRWMSALNEGTPLFGDDFHTEWSFYTHLSNTDLAALAPVLEAATAFQKRLPEGMPEEVRKTYKIALSESGKGFVLAMTKWFGQLQQSGQDAFILWW